MMLDGAEVILLSIKDNFGVIKYTDNSLEPIPVKYLAICKYEGDKTIYQFKCYEMIEVKQDRVFETIAEAKQQAAEINKNVMR